MVFGPLSAREADDLADCLARTGEPDADLSDLPWAAVVTRADGCVSCAASTMLPSGLFVADAPDGTWSVATDVMAAARVLPQRPQADLGFLRDFVVFRSQIDSSPLAGVSRIPGGETHTRNSNGRVTVRQWCGPESLPAPVRDGEDLPDEYLDRFDAVVRRLADRSPTLVTTLSGGLDSTFLAASLVRAAQGRTVHALCQTPLPGVATAKLGRFEADDYTYAQNMAAAYPDAIHLEPVRNDAHIHPLDAALAWARRLWWPSTAPANMVWMSAVADRADDLGATFRWYGVAGNAAFSSSHEYAFAEYLRSGRLLSAWSLTKPPPGRSRRQQLARQRATMRGQAHEDRVTRWASFGIAVPPSPVPSGDRQSYQKWLTGRLRSTMSSQGPAAATSLYIDPFSARSMIELAASISPRVWQAGDTDRAFARRLAQGRVPDSIRLRRTRGGQGFDAIAILREQPDRLLDPIRSDLPEWADLHVDTEALARTAQDLLSPDSTPHQAHLQDLLRIVATAEYLRELRTELSD